MRLRSQSLRAGLSLTIFALLALDLHAWIGSGLSQRNPVPEASAQAEAAKIAKEVYGDEYAAAKTSIEKRGLARKLLAKAGESENDLPGRYVLLRLSRDIAIKAGDIETAFLAVEQIGHSFEVNAVDLKREVLVNMAAMANTPAEHKALAEKCLAMFDQAAANDGFQITVQLGPLAIEESVKCKDQDLARRVPQRIAEIEELARNYEKVKAATTLLDKAPDEPEANLIVGSYMCFAKGCWDEGVPMLALGKDPALKVVAIKELDGAKSAQIQLALADEWRDLAEAQPAGIKKPMRERALFWYRKSLSGLTGLTKSKAEIRIKELAPDEIASQVSLRMPSQPKTIIPSIGDSPALGDYRRWQLKGNDSPLDAELKEVERATVVLKQKTENQIVKIAFENLSDSDQEFVSDWILRQSDRIWERGAARIGPRESREFVEAKNLAKALDGACIRTVFSINRASPMETGKSSAKLNLSGAWDSKLKEVVLPLPETLSARISRDAKLVVLGRLSVKYAACPLCGGTGLLKCPDCSHGMRHHMVNKPIVLPNGARINQSVQVAEVCKTCNGTGRHGDCQQHALLHAWEPFGTRKLPQGSFFTFTSSNGARRICVALDEPSIQILTSDSAITLRRVEGKIDVQTAPAGLAPAERRIGN